MSIKKLFKNAVLKSDSNRNSFEKALEIKARHNSNPTIGHILKIFRGIKNKYSSEDYTNHQRRLLTQYDNLKKNDSKQKELKKSYLNNKTKLLENIGEMKNNKAKLLNNIGEMKNNFQRTNRTYLNTLSLNKINRLQKII